MKNRNIMRKVDNPFVTSGKIKPKYFCDRQAESAELVKSITNDNNLMLISPRRMGKTGLIHFCYDQYLSEDYQTFFIDILHTTSLQEFAYIFGRQVYEAICPRSKKWALAFVQTLKSLSGQFGFDPLTYLPTFNLQLGDIIHPEIVLEEIFQYLEQADKPCIVAFDEFQQVANYKEKNIEALLRSHIQNATNTHFIFAGSEFHIMQEMFLSNAQPFYNSADTLVLKAIDIEKYTEFVSHHLRENHRSIAKKDIEKVYHLFRGNTYAMQKTFNEVFANTEETENCDIDTIEKAINHVIDTKEPLFREILSNIPEKHKPLLYAIAREGEVTQILSAKFIHAHRLTSASNVQHSTRQLIERGIITKHEGRYSLNEAFFALWINRLYGNATLSEILKNV